MLGKRIRLRAAEPTDVDAIYEWENDTDNWLVSNMVAPLSRHQILTFIENENDVFASHQMRFMIETHDKEIVGCIDLFEFDPKNHRVGLGVLIDRNHRGKGYGREAVGLAVDYAFIVLDVHCVFADVLVNNFSSLRIFESNGFAISGVRKGWLWDGHQHVDQAFLQRFKEE